MQERTRIVDFGPSKGRGLVSTVDVAPGAVLFEERPVVCAQYSWNKVVAPFTGRLDPRAHPHDLFSL